MSHKVLTVSETAVKACMDMKACLAVNRQAFIDLAQDKAVVPTRIGIPYQDPSDRSGNNNGGAADFSLFKPAAVPERDIMAIKLVSIRRHNPARHGLPLVPATVVSIDPSTGLVDGMVAGTYLTGARTATGSALSTRLYQPDLERVVIFGAGLQARLHIEAIATALERPIPHVTIVNRTVSRAQDLVNEIQEKNKKNNTCWAQDMDVAPLNGDDPSVLAKILSQADVIVTCTNTTTPLFPDSTELKPGCHICSVGSYTPEMQEIPPGVVDQCTVIIDTPDAKSVGDIKHLNPDQHPLYLLGNVLAATTTTVPEEQLVSSTIKPPRDEKMRYSFFKSVGTAVQDVYTTQMIMEKAREKGLGVEIEL